MKMKKVEVIEYINDWVDIDDPNCRRFVWKEYWAECPVCGFECGVTESGWTWSLCDHYREFDHEEKVMYFEDKEQKILNKKGGKHEHEQTNIQRDIR